MKHAAMAVLCFEAIAFGLAAPVMIMVEGVSTRLGLTAGLGLTVACLVACVFMRTVVGEWLGHAIQIVAIALGFVTPVMFVVGGMFAALWVAALWLGRRIQADRARWADIDPPG